MTFPSFDRAKIACPEAGLIEAVGPSIPLTVPGRPHDARLVHEYRSSLVTVLPSVKHSRWVSLRRNSGSAVSHAS